MMVAVATAPVVAQATGGSSSDKSHSSASAANSDFSGRHTMKGEVTKVDHVSVELALKPSGSASMGGSASPSTSRSSGSSSSGNSKPKY
jgi:hypothetical protein